MEPYFRFLQSNDTQEGVLEEPHTQSKTVCTWHKDDFYGTVNAKKSISAGMFLFFVAYTLFVMVRNTKKDTGVSIF